MHILIVSKSNLKLQVFGLFSRFVRTLIIKISSSEEPANSTSIHRVRNGDKLFILFHPSPKNIRKVSIAQLKTRKGAPKISKWRRTCRTNFLGAQNVPLLGTGKWSTISALPLLRPSGCSCALLLCHLQWESHQLSDTSISPSFKCIFRMQTCKLQLYSWKVNVRQIVISPNILAYT